MEEKTTSTIKIKPRFYVDKEKWIPASNRFKKIVNDNNYCKMNK